MLEKTLESPLDSKEIKPVNPKGINPEYSLEGLGWSWSTNTLATWCEEPTLWKRPWCWEDWGQKKGTTKDEMVGWPHNLNGHGFEQTLEDSEGQGSRPCCSPWGCKELDTSTWLNNNNWSLNFFISSGPNSVTSAMQSKVISLILSFPKNILPS